MLTIVREVLYLICFILKYYLTELAYFVFRSRPRKSFAGKSVLVTGSAKGMGALYCKKFAEMGCTVHCVDVDEGANEELVKGLTEAGHTAYCYICDVRNWDDLTELKENVEKNGPKIDVLINNAGVYIGRSLLDLTPKQISFTLDVNLLGQFYVTKQFLPGMLERGNGHIINIASIAGYLSGRQGSDYAASKWGSVGFSECLQQELNGTNIHCTFVCPWIVRTPLISGINMKYPNIFPMIEPERVVNEVIVGASENRERIFVPRYIQVLLIQKSILPKKIFDAINTMMGANNAIPADFKGRGHVDKIK